MMNKHKPHSYRNEYHSIAFCIYCIIFKIELVETDKDRSMARPYSKPEFEDIIPMTDAL